MLEVSITLDVLATHVFQPPPWQLWCIFHFCKWPLFQPPPPYDLVTLRPSGGVIQEWLMEGIVVSHFKGCVTVTLVSTLSWHKRKMPKKSHKLQILCELKLKKNRQQAPKIVVMSFLYLLLLYTWHLAGNQINTVFGFARVSSLRRPAVCDGVSEVQPRRPCGLESYSHSITVRSPLTLCQQQ